MHEPADGAAASLTPICPNDAGRAPAPTAAPSGSPAGSPSGSPADSPAVYRLPVRALCDFTARSGDLDLRFSPSPTAQQGIAGHQLLAARRGAGYEREIALTGRWGPIEVRGRADGFDPQLQRLEEFKTHRGDLSRQPANHRALHWAQLKVYGALLCEARGLSELRLALVYLDIDTQHETIIEDTCSAQDLYHFFASQCERFVRWAHQETGHRAARDAALKALVFPHPQFRPGQRDLSAAVWRAARTGGTLMAQATTGIGKTLATLFPLLRAAPERGLDKIVFLAARTPGRQLALDALVTLRAEAASSSHQAASTLSQDDSAPTPHRPLRVVEMTARDKACEHPDKACHGESCPLARGFYDRLDAARQEALASDDAASLRQVALRHEVCPYWLSQEMVRWADVIVGDYNYWFDASAMVHALATEREWRCAVLVDEAHNLPERARQMYSAQLEEAGLKALRRQAPSSLKKPLDKLARQWRDLGKSLDPGEDVSPGLPAGQGQTGTLQAGARQQREPYRVLEGLPERFVQALQQAAAAIADELAQAPQAPPALLQEFYFEALAFLRLAETFGDHSIVDLTARRVLRRRALTLSLRNLLPAPHLSSRFATAQVTVLFSATLQPAPYYRDMLGLPEEAPWLDVPSPFHASQLAVHLVPGISTRWSKRSSSVQPIACLIEQQFRAQPGNYLAFFSSYDYLGQVAQALQSIAPDVPQWRQDGAMRESDRRAFIDRFTPGGQGVGFAVLGGSFGEGIDLPGDRLVGAFIATLGLPQVNEINEQLRQRMERTFGAGTGFDYAYTYPGLRKVVQAAGRVIRTPQDRGTVYLIDERFCRPEIRQLLPAWWEPAVHALPGPARRQVDESARP